MVVRINTASKSMAKWYQKASKAPPVILEKTRAIPMAKAGAPPTLDRIVGSSIFLAISCRYSGVI